MTTVTTVTTVTTGWLIPALVVVPAACHTVVRVPASGGWGLADHVQVHRDMRDAELEEGLLELPARAAG